MSTKRDENRICLYKVDSSNLDVSNGLRLLSNDIQARIRAKRITEDRQSALASQLLQRYALINAVGGDFKDVKIDYLPNGKPYYVEYPEINYNVSHSENLLVLALIHSDKPIGVDIMKHDMTNVGDPMIYAGFFTETEMSQIMADKSNTAFRRLWVLKEAYLKATGQGITDDVKYTEIRQTNGNEFLFFNKTIESPFIGQLIELNDAIVGIVSIGKFHVDQIDCTEQLDQLIQKEI